MNTLDLESLLLAHGESIKKKDICDMCGIAEAELENLVNELKQACLEKNLPYSVSDNGLTIALTFIPEQELLLRKLHEDELKKPLSKASLETLTIVLYRSPVSRKEIDFIRGVQSQSILRSLQERGLVEKQEGSSGNLYSPTIELLNYLGISSTQELPEKDSFEKSVSQSMNDASTSDE